MYLPSYRVLDLLLAFARGTSVDVDGSVSSVAGEDGSHCLSLTQELGIVSKLMLQKRKNKIARLIGFYLFFLKPLSPISNSNKNRVLNPEE